MQNKPVLCIGGYGVTGSKVARRLRRLNPNLPLVIGGRSIEKARALARELGNAEAATVDLSRTDLGLEQADFSALAMFVYDQTKNSMRFAGRLGAGYLCLSGGGFEFGVDAVPAMCVARNAAVVIANNWFAGAVTMATLDLVRALDKVDTIEIGILIDRGVDGETSGGPATASDFGRILGSCPSTLLLENGRYMWVPPLEAKRPFRRADGTNVDGAGGVSADVLSIGSATGAHTVRVLEAWGMSSSRAAGGSASEEICIRVEGRDHRGQPRRLAWVVTNPRGHTTLTSMCCGILLERIIGADGYQPLPAGLYLPEHTMETPNFVQRMKDDGASFLELQP